MSVDSRYMTDTPNPLHNMMAQYGHSLTSQAIEDALRTADNLQTTKFMFHGWVNIPNREIAGNRGGLKPYAVLNRLQLIPLWAWEVVTIKNRTTGTISGDVAIGRVKAGTVIGKRTQLADESEKFVKKAYGMFGIDTLHSLTTDNNEGRQEAFMLFEAIMNSAARPGDKNDPREEMRGVDMNNVDLALFFKRGAPQALRYAIEHGMVVPTHLRSPLFPDAEYKFSTGAFNKGRQLITEMAAILEMATFMATAPASGVLVMTRNQLHAAEKGQRDQKMQLDQLDMALMELYPNFSMNSPEERAQRANEPLIEAIAGARSSAPAANNGIDARTVQMLIEQNQQLMDERREQNDRLRLLEQHVLGQQTVSAAGPSEPATAAASVVPPAELATDEPPSTAPDKKKEKAKG